VIGSGGPWGGIEWDFGPTRVRVAVAALPVCGKWLDFRNLPRATAFDTDQAGTQDH